MVSKIFIVSYKKKGKWNDIMHTCEKRFKEKGFTTKVVEGYNLLNHSDLKRNTVVYRNILDKIIPILEKTNDDGILFSEDDSYLADFCDKKFINKKLKENSFKKILRIGYQKILKYPKAKEHQRILLCRSSINLVSSSLVKIKYEMENNRAQHFDGFLSKNMNLDIKLLDREIQKNKKYVYELEHFSTTINKVRKGLKLKKTKKKK